MPAIIKQAEGVFVVNTRKHVMEDLNDVAKKDPEYLSWLYENTAINLNDEEFYALYDAMVAHNIPFP